MRCGKSQVTVSGGGDGGWRHQTRERLSERRVELVGGRVCDDVQQLDVPLSCDVFGAEAPDVVLQPDKEPLVLHCPHDPAPPRELVALAESVKDAVPCGSVVRGHDGYAAGLGRCCDDAEDGDFQLNFLCAQSNLLSCRCAALPSSRFRPDKMRISRRDSLKHVLVILLRLLCVNLLNYEILSPNLQNHHGHALKYS